MRVRVPCTTHALWLRALIMSSCIFRSPLPQGVVLCVCVCVCVCVFCWCNCNSLKVSSSILKGSSLVHATLVHATRYTIHVDVSIQALLDTSRPCSCQPLARVEGVRQSDPTELHIHSSWLWHLYMKTKTSSEMSGRITSQVWPWRGSYLAPLTYALMPPSFGADTRGSTYPIF